MDVFWGNSHIYIYVTYIIYIYISYIYIYTVYIYICICNIYIYMLHIYIYTVYIYIYIHAHYYILYIYIWVPYMLLGSLHVLSCVPCFTSCALCLQARGDWWRLSQFAVRHSADRILAYHSAEASGDRSPVFVAIKKGEGYRTIDQLLNGWSVRIEVDLSIIRWSYKAFFEKKKKTSTIFIWICWSTYLFLFVCLNFKTSPCLLVKYPSHWGQVVPIQSVGKTWTLIDILIGSSGSLYFIVSPLFRIQ